MCFLLKHVFVTWSVFIVFLGVLWPANFISNSNRRPSRKCNQGKRVWLKGHTGRRKQQEIDSCKKCVCVCVCVHPSHHSELLVEDHLLQQWGLIVEEVRLHVAPHVGEPPELIHVFQEQIVSLVLLHRACTHNNTHYYTHNTRTKGQGITCRTAHLIQIQSTLKKVL